MGTKTISIMRDVYDLLVARKRKDESFSGLLRRSFSQGKGIMEFAGAWKNLSENDTEDMKIEIEKLRKRSTRELLRK